MKYSGKREAPSAEENLPQITRLVDRSGVFRRCFGSRDPLPMRLERARSRNRGHHKEMRDTATRELWA